MYYDNPRQIQYYYEKIRTFRCLGVTDKELGPSLVDRCKKIIEIRLALVDMKCDIPLHIFGCLDPLCCLLFFLCGADVFDGLSWLRYAYLNNVAIYLEQAAILKGNCTLNDEDVLAASWIGNLNLLGKVQKSMMKYSSTFNANELPISIKERKLLKTVLREAGLSTKGVL